MSEYGQQQHEQCPPRRLWLVRMMLSTSMVLSLHTALGQTTAGSIGGQITDPSGSAVTQAKVTVTNKQTQEQRSTTSAGDGTYQLPLLPPGGYTITVESLGFRSSVA